MGAAEGRRDLVPPRIGHNLILGDGPGKGDLGLVEPAAERANELLEVFGIDAVDDDAEQINVTMADILNGVNGSTTNVIVAITDDDGLPTLTNDGGASNRNFIRSKAAML